MLIKPKTKTAAEIKRDAELSRELRRVGVGLSYMNVSLAYVRKVLEGARTRKETTVALKRFYMDAYRRGRITTLRE